MKTYIMVLVIAGLICTSFGLEFTARAKISNDKVEQVIEHALRG